MEGDQLAQEGKRWGRDKGNSPPRVKGQTLWELRSTAGPWALHQPVGPSCPHSISNIWCSPDTNHRGLVQGQSPSLYWQRLGLTPPPERSLHKQQN